MKYLTLVCCSILLCTLASAQNANQPTSISGTVVDARTGNPIEFVAVGVRGSSSGTITNAVGAFQLHVATKANDTLLFLMVGYHPVAKAISSIGVNAIVKMEEAPMLLKEVQVSGKRITVEDIFKSIKENVRKNYPVDEYAVECFYREIRKEKETYKSLLEAALVVKDKGYDQQKSPEIAFVREIRGSSKYVNKYSDFWQTNNLWRETVGLNAVRHPGSDPSVFGKVKYQLQGVSILNDKEVYVLVSNIVPNSSWQRTIYVDVDTYTIYRSEEVVANHSVSWKQNGQDTLSMRLTKGKSVFDFKEYNGRWYANYLRFECENEYFNPKTGQSYEKFTIINELMVNNIYEDARAVTSTLPRLEERSLDAQLTPYNESFWKNYNAVLQTPLEVEVMRDLMKDGKLKFVEAEKVSSKKKR